jgi:hypothetical protein
MATAKIVIYEGVYGICLVPSFPLLQRSSSGCNSVINGRLVSLQAGERSYGKRVECGRLFGSS